MRGVKLVLDENTNGGLESALKSLGFDTIRASQLVSQGTPDMEFIQVSTTARRTIITEDPQFGDVDTPVERDALDDIPDSELNADGVPSHLGILIARDEDVVTNPQKVAEAVKRVVGQYGPKNMRNQVIHLSSWIPD